MADQRVLELIKQQLADKWNLFRDEHPGEAIDLSGADLCEANLSEAIVTPVQLGTAKSLDDCL